MNEMNGQDAIFSQVSVIGLGYIGLPTAAVLAARKFHVLGVDINQSTVDIINSGEIHIVEPELDIIVHAAVTAGYLKARTTPEPAKIFIIAVPTPFKEEFKPDLSYIKSACVSVAAVLKKGDLVILESTSPVGTTEQLSRWFADIRQDLTFPHLHGSTADVCIAYCPERVLPGRILHELVQNDRVIGGLSETCSKKAADFYKLFIDGDCLITNARTAEMCKLAENSFRDVNIAFANELSFICDKLDINIWELIKLANKHPRVDILRPGAGVGGHCIAVDPWFLVSSAPNEAKIVQLAREVNDKKPEWVLNKVFEGLDMYLKKNPQKNKKDISIACFGLAFKPNIDDLRESPAVKIARSIGLAHPGLVLFVEPNILKLPYELQGLGELVSFEKAVVEAEIKVCLVAHSEFINDLNKIECAAGLVLDICGFFS